MKIKQRVKINLTAEDVAELLKNTFSGKIVGEPELIISGNQDSPEILFEAEVEVETSQSSGLHFPPGVRGMDGGSDHHIVRKELTGQQVLEDMCRER